MIFLIFGLLLMIFLIFLQVIKVADHLEEAAGTMAMEANLVDHITEMVIMTALDKTAVTAVMAEAAVR